MKRGICIVVERSTTEAEADFQKTWAQTRNCLAQLGGVHFTEGVVDNAAWIEFFSARHRVLNAGAKLPIAWLDQLCVEWAKARDLWPKLELYRANIALLEQEVSRLRTQLNYLTAQAETCDLPDDLLDCLTEAELD